MKVLAMMGWLLVPLAAAAQSTRITPPSIGPSRAETGAAIQPREPQVRQVTYLVLSDTRQWTSADGREIFGKLVAFEEMVVEESGGEVVAPKPPARPTVVRGGSIRLLVDRKVSVVPLERLSEEDRKFVEGIRVLREKGSAAGEGADADAPD
jgi:hypothetical protein